MHSVLNRANDRVYRCITKPRNAYNKPSRLGDSSSAMTGNLQMGDVTICMTENTVSDVREVAQETAA